MLDKTYQTMMWQVTPSAELLYQTKERLACQRPKRTMNRLILVVVTMCVCISISITVLAANGMLFNIAPQLAQFLQPINLECENNGIKMNVLAAMNDDETAVVYLTFQDIESNRVDKTVDLYNYSILGYRAFTHELVKYDEQTKTATIRLLANGGEKLNGKKITLHLNSFLSGKQVYNNVQLPINLQDANNNVPDLPLDFNNISGGGGEIQKLKQQGTMQVLTPKSHSDKFVGISAIGYDDEFLHIQTEWEDSVDNHGFVTLKDANGEEILPYANVYFGINKNGKTCYGKRYVEYIYKIEMKDLIKYKVYGTFVENKCYTEGDWKVTFQINAVDPRSIVKKDIQVGKKIIDGIKMSPLGICVSSQMDVRDLKIVAVMRDGTEIPYTNCISADKNVKYLPTQPVNIDDISKIKIGDTYVPID